jgi:DNA-binding NarL/FixJ family response regulator
MRGPAGELFPRHATAQLTDDPKDLEATALALADAGFNLCASACAADASRSYRRHGITGGATRCAALAHRLLEMCEGAQPAAISDLAAAELTTRERDVTLLAAQGMTNKEIADVTCTSLRTVEGHLLRAYRKLGVTSRAELASYLRPG